MPNVLEALSAAVQAAPDSAPLRVQYARILLLHGRAAEAVQQAGTALRLDPGDQEALALVTQAAAAITSVEEQTSRPARSAADEPTAASPTEASPTSTAFTSTSAGGGDRRPAPSGPVGEAAGHAVPDRPAGRAEPARSTDAHVAPPGDERPPGADAPPEPAFDWRRAEEEIGLRVPRPFVEDGGTGVGHGATPPTSGPPRSDASPAATSAPEAPSPEARHGHGASPGAPPAGEAPDPGAPGDPGAVGGPDGRFLVPARDDTSSADGLLEVSRETVTLADVGGLEPVKKRIREAFLEPMRHQAIARAFGKSLRGGLLLYGPPGTGKTFMARAVAGELGARFLTVTLADILDKYIGESEQNLHDLFQRARRLAPAVLFLDEVDAIGGKRTQYSGSSGMRTVVNQLLQEMDGIGSDNDGLFVLGATNHPWDVDSALLRPGRFDRMVLVLPPDAPARESILRHYLEGRPIAGISLSTIVEQTDGFSGADLEHLCASAAEKAMMDSIATGEIRPITMDDVRGALADVRPSTTAWLHSARNVVTFANNDGRYDDLAAYLRSRRML